MTHYENTYKNENIVQLGSLSWEKEERKYINSLHIENEKYPYIHCNAN